MRPSTLRILGKTYEVRATEDQLRGGHVGLADNEQCCIWIRTDQCLQQEQDTLLHEAIHAMDFAVHIGLEERQVHALGAAFYALLRDNPELAKWLSE